MPEICRFFGIVIYMYREIGGKHHFPHIHAAHGNFKAVFNRVVPLDNFMIYKDIIRLDRPD